MLFKRGKMRMEFSSRQLRRHYDRKIVRRLNDMRDSFRNSSNVRGNPILYKVYIKDFGSFESGLTVINPGAVNKEFYMTKGHRHKKPLSEIYILMKGKGKILIQGKGGTSDIGLLKKGKIYIIPSESGHRIINTGRERLEVLTIYSKNAGHDYDFNFKKRLFK